MSSKNKPLLMSLSDFAAHISVSLSTLRRRVDEGVIPVLHEGRRVSVPVAIAEKRYLAYLVGKEREYRAARVVAKVGLSEPSRPTFAERAWDVAQRSGIDLNLHDSSATDDEDKGEPDDGSPGKG